MNGWSDTITGTGLIATLVAILFAIAATFITRRRQQIQQLSTPPPAATPAPTQDTPRNATLIIPNPAAPTDGSPAANPPVLATASAPLFKKLGSRGIEDPHSDIQDNQTYVWE